MHEYIDKNKGVIAKYHQDPLGWEKDAQRNLAKQNLQFLLNVISERNFEPFSRKDVVNAYNTSLYKGFICMLLWGGMHLNNLGSLLKILEIPQNEIEAKLKNAKSLLVRKELGNALDSMLEGRNKIQNIGPSYATKILYFMSKAFDEITISPQPLIFDRHMQYVHAALLIADENNEESSVLSFYSYSRKTLRNKNYKEAYLDFCKRMWSACRREFESDKLEAYMFNNKSDDPEKASPREYVKQYVDNYFRNYKCNERNDGLNFE